MKLIDLAQSANNMIDVENTIAQVNREYLNRFAVEFGRRDKNMETQDGYVSRALTKYQSEIRTDIQTVIDNIPDRLRTTKMYKALINRLSWINSNSIAL